MLFTKKILSSYDFFLMLIILRKRYYRGVEEV